MTNGGFMQGIISVAFYFGVGFAFLVWNMGSIIDPHNAWTYAYVLGWPLFLILFIWKWVALIALVLFIVAVCIMLSERFQARR